MELTGKCKEDFEKWFLKDSEEERKALFYNDANKKIEIEILDSFYILGYSAKYGVYVDFFDSVGLRIIIRNVGEPYPYWYVIHRKKGLKDKQGGDFISRPEARTAAIEKANELHNSKN